MYYGTHVWDHVPAEIKAVNNIKTFLKLVRYNILKCPLLDCPA